MLISHENDYVLSSLLVTMDDVKQHLPRDKPFLNHHVTWTKKVAEGTSWPPMLIFNKSQNTENIPDDNSVLKLYQYSASSNRMTQVTVWPDIYLGGSEGVGCGGEGNGKTNMDFH